MHLRLLPALILLSSSALAATPRANPLVTVPQTDSTLSVLQPRGRKLAWLRIDPVSKKSAVVAIVPRRSQVSWSFDGRKALLWTPCSSGRRALSLIEISISTEQLRAIPAPPDGAFEWAGFDKKSRIHAETSIEVEKGADGKIHFDGQAYDYPYDDGSPTLSNDFVLARTGHWQHVRSAVGQPSDCDPFGDVPAAPPLGPTTANRVSEIDSIDDSTLPDPTLRPLMASTPDDPAASGPGPKQEWRRLRTTPDPSYVRAADGQDPCWTSSERVAVIQRHRVHLLGMPDKQPWTDAASVTVRGPYVLVVPQSEGGARLFDIRSRKAVFQTDHPVCFWPAPEARALGGR